jgi:hypothetical protein
MKIKFMFDFGIFKGEEPVVFSFTLGECVFVKDKIDVCSLFNLQIGKFVIALGFYIEER